MNRMMTIFAVFVFTGFILAQEPEIVDGNKLESWYTYWGIGYATAQYPNELQDLLDLLEDQDGVERTEMGFDMLGFYFPVNEHHTAVGFVINSAADRFDIDDYWFQINQFTYSASLMHYFNNTVGKGFFLRGDIGLAVLSFEDSDDNSSTSDSGIGVLVGGGYGFNIGSGTRISANLNYSYRSVEGDECSALGITAGFMF